MARELPFDDWCVIEAQGKHILDCCEEEEKLLKRMQERAARLANERDIAIGVFTSTLKRNGLDFEMFKNTILVNGKNEVGNTEIFLTIRN